MIMTASIVVFLLAAYAVFFYPRSQIAGNVIYRVPSPNKKVVALSFDDGPNDPFTSEILNILRAHGVKATFFIVGRNAERDPKTVQKIFREGHAIGNHSYSHDFFAPLRFPHFENEIVKTQEILFALTGKKPIIFRPPWFFRQPFMLRTAARLGLHTVTGAFASNWEVLQISAAEIARAAYRRTKPGTILCFHDGYNTHGGNRAKTVEAIQLLVPRLLQDDFTFVTIPQLCGFPTEI